MAQTLSDKHTAIQNEIQKLTAIETYLFNELNKQTDGTDESTQKSLLINQHIDDIKSSREKLINDLSRLFETATGELSFNSRHLANQQSMSSQINTEIQKTQNELNKLTAEKNNKTRLAQIGEYEFEKNREHRSILKTIVYASFFILIISYFNSIMILPNTLTRVLIIIICSIALLLLVQRFYWNFRRDNIDYSKFRQQADIPNVISNRKTENTFSLRKMMGFESCEKDIHEIAREAAEAAEASESEPFTGLQGFTNFRDVFPCQSTFLENTTKPKKNDSSKLNFSLL